VRKVLMIAVKRIPKFIEFKQLKSFECLPNYSSSISRTLMLISEIDVDDALFVFVSHRGVLVEQEDARPLPDTPGNDKFRLLIEAVEKTLINLTPGLEHCYLWIDCVCWDLSSPDQIPYEEIFEVVDLVMTPMFDPSVPFDVDENFAYDARPWGYGPEAYLGRSWCRLEMLFSAAIALSRRKKEQSRRGKLSETFLSVVDVGVRPHLLYGSFESARNLPPLVLPDKDDRYEYPHSSNENPPTEVMRMQLL
jgi:hypothetical protein